MLLQRLKEYADQRLVLPPTLYNETPVRYIIELDSNGRLLNPRPTDTADPASPRTRRGQRRLAPQVQRASGVKPLLLADKAEYSLGLGTENSKPDRVAKRHRAYMELLTSCLTDTHEPSVAAVHAFLTADPTTHLELPEDFDRGATITFRVDGVFPIDLPSVQAFWAAENDPARAAAPVMQCVVCGHERPVLPRLQAKIKGVPGGQTSGTSIISANAEAFESYGLEASLIAPTCADCGEGFTQAANSLLTSQANQIRLGGAAFIFWTRQEVGFDLLTYITDPQAAQVRDLVASVLTGWSNANAQVDDTAFYATALSGSGGRAVVRDWMDTTVGQVKEALASWFQRQRIAGPNGEAPRPLGINALAYATVREARDLAPPVPRTLVSAALAGTPLQWDLLYQAVRRNRAEQRVTHPRAALIKLVLLGHQQISTEEDYMVQLDSNHPSAAYHCGRLLAVLEQAQRAAVPGINATIVDRFYGTASSAPASVFSRLVRGAQPHLAKLQRDRRGAYYALQGRLDDIMGRIPGSGFPRTLNLEEQGIFSLGYYHQRAHDRAQAREGAERRRQQAQPGAELTLDITEANHQHSIEEEEK
jgi:CRISPR-associated protein Csd1